MGKLPSIILSLFLRIVLSPILILIIGYIYFKDTRKAFLITLYAYSLITFVSLIFTGFMIFTSMMTFNIIAFFKKSAKVIAMLISLALYWFGFIMIWGINFNL